MELWALGKVKVTDGARAGRDWRTVPLERIRRSWKEPPGYCCGVEQVMLKLWPFRTEPAGASVDVLYQCWGVRSSTVIKEELHRLLYIKIEL